MVQHKKGPQASVVSPGVIAEPFKGEEPAVGWGRYLLRFVTPSGWRELKRDFMTAVKTGFAIAKFRNRQPGFGMAAFREDALALYTEVCSALAAGDHSVLRQAATPKHYINLKKQLAARQGGGWAHVAWGLAEQPSQNDVHLLQARLLMMDPKDEKYAYGQFTVRFWTSHTFAAYDARGKLVAGDPVRPLPVQDVWVLERALLPGPLGRWRAAAQISLPAAADAAALH
ncbi:hypothetical protein WJX81_007908 [Elliptochloris bilobata]|uniref:Large ribosomal subunit protein mL45 n=1 Tax=Elliptochloris bilobata TaxID=381761 RepID=A0AAW1QXX2_9CHLO